MADWNFILLLVGTTLTAVGFGLRLIDDRRSEKE